MSETYITEKLRQSIAAKRQDFHPFGDADPARTALLVIDMQNCWVAPGGASEVPGARGLVDGINQLAAAMRRAGGLVVFLQHVIDEQALREWSTFFRYFVSPERMQRLTEACAPGSEGGRLWQGLEPRPGDEIVPKRRFSAFVPGSSDLHELLRARGIDTIVVTGVVTNVCCESTARDAMMMNYKVFFISDGCATGAEGAQDATLCSMATYFADVRSTGEMLALIEAKGKARADA